jgi:hypothetical protein
VRIHSTARTALRDQRGQTAPEYMGMLLIVSLIVAALFASGLGGAIVGRVQVLICQIAGGQACEERFSAELEPCLVSSSEQTANFKLFVGFVEVGKDSILLREDFSDGTTRFTLIDSTELKGELFAGVRAKAGKFGLSAAAEAAAGGQLEGAQVFEVPTEDAERFEESVAAAGGFDGLLRDYAELNDEIPIIGIPNPFGGFDDWMLDRLGVDEDDPQVDPTEEYVNVSAIIGADAGAGAGIGILDADVEASVEGAAGAKIFHEGERSGEVELYYSLEGDVGGNLTAGLLGPNVEGDASVVATLVLDANGEPKTLKLTGTAGFTGALGVDQEIEGLDAAQLHRLLEEASLSATAGEGTAIEAGAELDLTDPANRDVALRLLTPNVVSQAAAVPDLIDRLESDGRLTLDLFNVSKDEAEGEVKIGLGVGGGAGGSHTTEDRTATGSYVREPGGTFQQRACAR